MFNIRIDWLSFVASVVMPLVVSLSFFIVYYKHKKKISRLLKRQCNTVSDYEKKTGLIQNSAFIANISLCLFITFLLFGLTMAAVLLKFF